MKKREVKEWENSTRKTLDAIWKFRKLCKRPFDRGFIGELLVLERLLRTYGSTLCASVDNKFSYAGSSNKQWDVELTINGRTVYINAKATTEKDNSGNPKFVRQHAGQFCCIRQRKTRRKKSRQYIYPRQREINPNLFYVFVDVGAWLKNRKTRFFTLSDERISAIFYKEYHREWHGRERGLGCDDFWIRYKYIKNEDDPDLEDFWKEERGKGKQA